VIVELSIVLKHFLNRSKCTLNLILILLIISNICVSLSQSISYAQILQLPKKLGVKIAFPFQYQEVPTGEVPMFGSSTDNEITDCIIYADWNDNKEFKEVMPIGPGGDNDFSTWMYTYTQKDHPITNGINDLTAKMICSVDNINFTKYTSIQVIGSSSEQILANFSNIFSKYYTRN
jgi:hypothetical protein